MQTLRSERRQRTKIKVLTIHGYRRRAKVMEMNPGDMVVVKQEKSSLHPSWDPRPFTITKVKGTKVFLEHLSSFG